MGLIEKRGTTDGTGPNYHAALTLWNENDCREYNNICKYSGWGGWSITYTTKDRPTASDVNAPTIEEFNSLKTSLLKTTSMSVNTYQVSFNGSWNTVYSCFGRTNNNRFSIIGFPNNANRVIYLYYDNVNGTDYEGNTSSYLSTGPVMTNSLYACTIYIVYS